MVRCSTRVIPGTGHDCYNIRGLCPAERFAKTKEFSLLSGATNLTGLKAAFFRSGRTLVTTWRKMRGCTGIIVFAYPGTRVPGYPGTGTVQNAGMQP
eukprot:2222467-Rhodomonas_salina.3